MSDEPRKLLGWRAWLASESDGSDLQVVDSRTTQFEDLTNVQVIVLYREDGTRHVMNGIDYYWLTRQCVSFDACFGCGNKIPPEATTVVEGKEIDPVEYERIQSLAMSGREF